MKRKKRKNQRRKNHWKEEREKREKCFLVARHGSEQEWRKQLHQDPLQAERKTKKENLREIKLEEKQYAFE